MNDPLEQELEILPGNPGTPFFKTDEEERKWREEFETEIKKELDKLPKPLWFRPYPR